MKLRALTFLCLLCVPAVAHAQGTSKDAVAEGLFQEAKKLLAAGNVHDACEKFKASLDVDHASGTLTALAFCHQKEGKTASAWAEFTEVAVDAKKTGKADQEKYARDQIATLEKVLRRVTIDVASSSSSSSSVTVKIDGVVLPSSALGTPIPVDPGERVFEASAPKRISKTTRVVIEPGPGVTPVHLPALAIDPAGESKAPTSSQPRAVDKTRLILGGIVALVGAIGIGGGAYYQFVVAQRQQDDAVFLLREAYDQAGHDDKHDQALVSSTVGITSMAVGTAAFGVGLYLVISALSSSSSSSSSSAAARSALTWGTF